MAEIPSVWGIDIGQAGLKAIHLRYAEAANQVLAVGFDYIPHPKILSQPDAIPAELIAEAMKTFLTRNADALRGSLLAISAPSKDSIVKFVQLPPVESKKVGDIVRYEARQQIPFPLEDVIWDWQTMGGGVEEGGYMLDAEVGIVAMKTEIVKNSLKIYTENKVEIELIQAPQMALFNFLCYDQFGMRAGESCEQDGYTLLLDMGADTTTMIASNGQKLWVRNISIGGNQFTRALTKEMKLTFAKAEHLKCNATKSEDPKAVFQALRPVFNDYVSEIQRSIGFFSSVNRDAKISKILAVGNGFKLAGLQKFLQQNLQYDVERVESFPSLVGDIVLGQPLFQDNAMAFAVPYGLALQLLNVAPVKASLLPPEIKTARMIRKKKPWAVAAAAVLLGGFSLSTMGFALANTTVAVPRWKDAEQQVQSASSKAGTLKSEYEKLEKDNKDLREKGNFLVKRAEGRRHWMEVYKAINSCLPMDTEETQDNPHPGAKLRLRFYNITCRLEPDLESWFKMTTAAKPNVLDFIDAEDKTTPPKGSGYVFTLKGLHYHDSKGEFVPRTFIQQMQQWQIPTKDGVVPVRQIGITHVMQIRDLPRQIEYWPNGKPGEASGTVGFAGMSRPGMEMMGGASMMGGPMGPGRMGRPARTKSAATTPNPATAGKEGQPIRIWQTDFEVVFVWRETAETDRTPERPAPAATPGTPGANAAPGAPTTTPPGMAAPPIGTPGAVAPMPGTTPMGTVPPAGSLPMTPSATIPPGAVPPGTVPPGAVPMPMGATVPATPGAP